MLERIAFFAFPGLTLLDLVGVYDALRRVPLMGIDPRTSLRVVGTQTLITDDSGLIVNPQGVYEDLAPYDLLVVPGGAGTRRLMHDPQCVDYLKGWGKTRPIASVCTGALLLGASGHLKGKRATTHHAARDVLAPMVKEVAEERIVEDGHVTTAGGVTSALDLGLHLVARYWGDEASARVADVMEYRTR